ncbi:MAG: glycosyltransferase family 2 protein [Candidatus Omnitrophica bacterium]|nr:glycosyltransferase family 2 protein [Candidatus Omnitrophota bacterium]
MEKGLVSAIIVTRNNADTLRECITSLLKQTYGKIEIIAVDNASNDNAPEIIAKHKARLIKNDKNQGFARANNQGINVSSGEYILFINDDVTLDEKFIDTLLREMERDLKTGSACGKILAPNATGGKSVIDSAGLKLQNWRLLPLDRGEGETDKGQFDKKEYVFGVPGAVSLYRRSALDEIKINGEYFDEDFFAYYEDVDLAWRLSSAGWKSLYVPEARAFHKKKGPSEKETFIKAKALANRYWCYLKNETLLPFLFYAPIAIPYELIRVIKKLTLNPELIPCYFYEWKLAGRMVGKRKLVRKKIT